jgi:hypothetical protein
MYRGEFKQGCKNNKGIMTYADGTIFDGEYSKDKKDGFGIEKSPTGNVYKGEYYQGKKEGFGIYKFSNVNNIGATYEGEFKDNFLNGKGIINYLDGSYYEGDWRSGVYHGYGVYKSSDGDEYNGEFIDNLKNGRGTLIYSNNDVYVGEFQDGDCHGIGVLTYNNGDIFTGKFQNNCKHGPGNYNTPTDGEIYNGIWDNDELTISGTPLEIVVKKTFNNFMATAIKSTIKLMRKSPHKIEKKRRNLRNGFIVEKALNKVHFEGNYIHNKRNGYGVYKYLSAGSEYDGNWFDDVKDGNYILNFLSLSIYLSNSITIIHTTTHHLY